MELNKIYNMDCIKGMEKLGPSSVDIIITSPPYNIGVEYNLHNDNMEFEDYLNWMGDFGRLSKKVLKEKGHYFLT